MYRVGLSTVITCCEDQFTRISSCLPLPRASSAGGDRFGLVNCEEFVSIQPRGDPQRLGECSRAHRGREHSQRPAMAASLAGVVLAELLVTACAHAGGSALAGVARRCDGELGCAAAALASAA